MDLLKTLLAEKGGDLAAALVDKAGFAPAEADSFVPAATGSVLDLLKGSGASRAALLSDPQALLSKLDVQRLAAGVGIGSDKARGGLLTLLPLLQSLLGEKAGGLGAVASLLGATSGNKGNVAGALGSLFGRK